MGGGGPVARDAQGNIIKFPSRFTMHLFWGVLVAAAGGLLFGFDNGLTGGVSEMPGFLRIFFPEIVDRVDTNSENPYCEFQSQTLELYTSCAYLTGTVAAPIAAIVTQKVYDLQTEFDQVRILADLAIRLSLVLFIFILRGRKWSLVIGGGLYLVGALLQAASFKLPQLLIGRLILGLGVGFANQVSPLYLNEVAPTEIRGTLNLLYQLFTTLGIFLAQLINLGTSKYDKYGWRASLAIQGFPGIICLFAGLLILETPNSLVERGMIEKVTGNVLDGGNYGYLAKKGSKTNLLKMRGVTEQEVQQEFDLIVYAAEESKLHNKPWKALHSQRNAPQAVIAYLIPFFQQFTGVNVLMFYAPQIFSTLGQSQQKALEHSIIMGLTNFVATFVAIFLVDRVGRKALFIEAGFQMSFSYVIITAVIGSTFTSKGSTPFPEQQVLLAFICLFVAAYAWSWGPLTFLVPPEVLTLETRSAGQAIVVGSEFMFSFVIAQAFLDMFCSMRYGVFIFFCFWCIIMTLFVWLLVPETKGIPLEAVSQKFKGHWFWKGVVRQDPHFNPDFRPSLRNNNSMNVHQQQFATKEDIFSNNNNHDLERNGSTFQNGSFNNGFHQNPFQQNGNMRNQDSTAPDTFLIQGENGHKGYSHE